MWGLYATRCLLAMLSDYYTHVTALLYLCQEREVGLQRPVKSRKRLMMPAHNDLYVHLQRLSFLSGLLNKPNLCKAMSHTVPAEAWQLVCFMMQRQGIFPTVMVSWSPFIRFEHLEDQSIKNPSSEVSTLEIFWNKTKKYQDPSFF